MGDKNSVVAVYSRASDAEDAVRKLQRAGVDMKTLSVVGRDASGEKVVGYSNSGDCIKFWGRNGRFWGVLCGCLFGAALFVVPGIENLVVLGPLVNAIGGVIDDTALVGGLSILGAGLFSLGISQKSVLQYETAIRANKFLLIGYGTEGDVIKAHEIIETTNVTDCALHAAAWEDQCSI
jgi:uncharacterized membrane protein